MSPWIEAAWSSTVFRLAATFSCVVLSTPSAAAILSWKASTCSIISMISSSKHAVGHLVGGDLVLENLILAIAGRHVELGVEVLDLLLVALHLELLLIDVLPHRLQLFAELVQFVLALLDARLAGANLPGAAIAAILEIGQLLMNAVQGSQDVEADCGVMTWDIRSVGNGVKTKRAVVEPTTARRMCREGSDRPPAANVRRTRTSRPSLLSGEAR